MQSQNIVKNAIGNYLKLNNKIIGYIDTHISIAKKENLVTFGFIKIPNKLKPIYFQLYPDFENTESVKDIIKKFKLDSNLKSNIGKLITKLLHKSNFPISNSTLKVFNELVNSIILEGHINYGLIIKSVNFSLFKINTKEINTKEILEKLGKYVVKYANEMLINNGFVIPIYENRIIRQYIQELSILTKNSPEIVKIWFEDEINRLFKLFNTIYKTTGHIPLTFPIYSKNDNSLYYIIHLKPIYFDVFDTNNSKTKNKTEIEPLSNKIGKIIYMDLLEILTNLSEIEPNTDKFEKLISQFLADVILKQYINQVLSPIGTIYNGIEKYYQNNILYELENLNSLDNKLYVLNNPIYEEIFGIKFIIPLYVKDSNDYINKYKFIITPENIDEFKEFLESFRKDIKKGQVIPLEMKTSLSTIPQLSTKNKYNIIIEINIIGKYNKIFDKLKNLGYSLVDIYRILSDNSKYLVFVLSM